MSLPRDLLKLTRFMRRGGGPAKGRIARGYLGLLLRRGLRLGLPSPQKFGPYAIAHGNGDLLCEIIREIFIEEIYRFPAATDAPLVIDAGANIGIATLYVKHLYPNAKVHCYEPVPSTLKWLRANVEQNGLTNVTIHEAALGGEAGEIELVVRTDTEGGDIGASTRAGYRELHHRRETLERISVRCERISELIGAVDTVDFLKLDIEGGEEQVFDDLAPHLDKVRHFAMEYHYIQACNPLSKILRCLEDAGHHYVVQSIPLTGYPQSYELLIRSRRIES